MALSAVSSAAVVEAVLVCTVYASTLAGTACITNTTIMMKDRILSVLLIILPPLYTSFVKLTNKYYTIHFLLYIIF